MPKNEISSKKADHFSSVFIVILLLVILFIFGFLEYRKIITPTPKEKQGEFIYDINDTVGGKQAILITWRTNEKTTQDFVEVGKTKDSYQLKAIAKYTDTGLYHWANLTGLEENATYHYRIAAVDSEGKTKATTKDRTFKTYFRDYNTLGSLDFVTTKEPDSVWLVSKDQKKRIFSLGAYKLPLEKNTFLMIPKFWVLFTSDALSNRGDDIFGIQDAYLSRILFRKDSKTRELKLGTSGEHMLIELGDYPFGNLTPQDKNSEFEFEILVELACNNFQNGGCLDNEGRPLDYINNADINAEIRIPAVSFQNFEKVISTSAKFKYE